MAIIRNCYAETAKEKEACKKCNQGTCQHFRDKSKCKLRLFRVKTKNRGT